MGLSVGTRLGSYEILSLLGAGGMGEVYRARDSKLCRSVAIKVLSSDVARDPEKLDRFRREAKVLASLNHPNIASIYGFEDSDKPGLGNRAKTLDLPQNGRCPKLRDSPELLRSLAGQRDSASQHNNKRRPNPRENHPEIASRKILGLSVRDGSLRNVVLQPGWKLSHSPLPWSRGTPVTHKPDSNADSGTVCRRSSNLPTTAKLLTWQLLTMSWRSALPADFRCLVHGPCHERYCDYGTQSSMEVTK